MLSLERSIRRGLLAVATMTVVLLPARGSAQDTSIRPYRVHVPDSDLADLRRRIAATRWPDKETVADASQVRRSRSSRSWSGTGAPATTGGGSRRG